MSSKQTPYRITIELATGERGKTMVVTGETPWLGRDDGGITDANACAMASNALVWESHTMAHAGSDHAAFDRRVRALNIPLNTVPH